MTIELIGKHAINLRNKIKKEKLFLFMLVRTTHEVEVHGYNAAQ